MVVGTKVGKSGGRQVGERRLSGRDEVDYTGVGMGVRRVGSRAGEEVER